MKFELRKEFKAGLYGIPGGPGSIPGLVKWDLWWTKWRWGGFSPSTSVSPANLHSTKFSIIIITRAGTIGQSVAAVPSGPCCTPLKSKFFFIFLKEDGPLNKINLVYDMTHRFR
jgi:hypothetical protein